MKATSYYQSGRQRAAADAARAFANSKVCCIYCRKEVTLGNLRRHSDSCWLNPSNIRACEVCGEPVKNYKVSVTCGYSCSNKLFRARRNTSKTTNYTAICFRNHEKRCVVCGEEHLVAVHHYDENHENNDPYNLVPLCPTHHGYMHSNLRHIHLGTVDAYRDWWAGERERLQRLASDDAERFHGRVRLTRSTVPKGWQPPYIAMVPRFGNPDAARWSA